MCPRCGQDNPQAAAECARCGVVFARVARPVRPRPIRTAPPPTPPASSAAAALRIGAVIAALLVAGLTFARWSRTPGATAARASTQAPPASTPELLDPPPAIAAAFAPPPTDASFDAGATRPLDADSVRDLERLKALANAIPTEADLDIAERLLARHGADLPGLAGFVAGLFVRAAGADHEAHRSATAVARLGRATELAPERVEPWLALAAVRLDGAQWAEAETAARRAIELDGGNNAAASLQLAWAQYRQDRNREAAATLEALLAGGEDRAARALLDRIRKQARDEAGMAEQRTAHFNLRFEGEEAAEVGHEILQALARHRATLLTTLYHEPQAPIPVILFSREAYYDAAGAPRWSGGVFDSIDGRIRIPIGGLDRSLPPEMDQTLIHEVTHAFLADLSRGVCPRDVHEGFAQYMEGKRSEQELGERGLAALAAGRIRGVQGFYAGALSFVEFLIAERGLGGIRELLTALGETRSEEAAFESVYGRGAAAQRKAWLERLRQNYSR